jgi:hypothetical protein
MTFISKDDPRHAAAKRVLEAMFEFWKLAPFGGAVQWIEDIRGRVVVFTRGEYRDRMMRAVGENLQPTSFFELEDEDPEGVEDESEDDDA